MVFFKQSTFTFSITIGAELHHNGVRHAGTLLETDDDNWFHPRCVSIAVPVTDCECDRSQLVDCRNCRRAKE